MYKRSDFIKPAYKTAELMKILNVSFDTIKRYDKKRLILPIRARLPNKNIVTVRI